MMANCRGPHQNGPIHLLLSINHDIKIRRVPLRLLEVVTYINTSLAEQNGRHFADDIFRCNFVNKNVFILNIKFH